MAQNQNGLNRRSSNVTRTYPGTASRVSSSAATPLVEGFGRVRPGGDSVPTVFSRPLSRSQLAPVHGVGQASPLSPGSTRSPPPLVAARPISLDTPRPDSERHRNLYLGAPISVSGGGGGGGHGTHAPVATANNAHKDFSDSSGVTAAEQVRLPTSSRSSKSKSHSDRNSHGGNVVTLQPTKRTLLEEREDDGGKVKLAESSIICPYCRKCRCEACATPRALPSRWICSESIHCGPEPMLDYCTCLCCVKALFYHCGKDHEPDSGVICADKPCSCAPHRKFWRWGCMAAMSVVFPCLCFYWPCKGCLRLTEKAYQKYHSNGCRCKRLPETKPTAGEESSEDEDFHHHHHHRVPFPQVIVPPRPSSATFLPAKKH